MLTNIKYYLYLLISSKISRIRDILTQYQLLNLDLSKVKNVKLMIGKRGEIVLIDINLQMMIGYLLVYKSGYKFNLNLNHYYLDNQKKVEIIKICKEWCFGSVNIIYQDQYFDYETNKVLLDLNARKKVLANYKITVVK